MARINDHYLKLAAGYLFPEIGRRVRAFQDANPKADIIRLGIGDVVLPIPASIRDAMHRAIDELGVGETFRGYGPEQGYDFLRDAIAEHDFKARGANVAPDEVFVSDGSKCDSGNILEIFATAARVAIPDPVYPVYVDTNVMAGHTGAAGESGRYDGITYLPCTEANGFRPTPPDAPVDLVYLCFPNNPTGAVATKAELAEWVRWAKANDAVLLYDAAYAGYIRDASIPRSIYEIPGAREVAIEFRSFSKLAGFTGLRCGYVVVPKELVGKDANGNPVELHRLWLRRQSTKFNGASYPIQAGAAACYTDAGRRETRANIDYYMRNASTIRTAMSAAGLRVFGAENAPYAWIATPKGVGSWDFFDRLLTRANVVCTPGAGFGACGEGYVRLSAFGKAEKIEEALARVRRELGAGVVDFRDSPEQARLREDVRAFAASDPAVRSRRFPEDGWIAGFDPEFSRRLAARGWLGMTWPKRYGGQERSYLDRLIVTEELLLAGAPVAAHWFGDRQIGPALLAHGTPAQKSELVPRIARAEISFCIGMSEPNAGSDLAGLTTRADLDGDGFVIRGQKTWTSFAEHADYCYLVARTNPDAPKHKGISELLVPMNAPGITDPPDRGHGRRVALRRALLRRRARAANRADRRARPRLLPDHAAARLRAERHRAADLEHAALARREGLRARAGPDPTRSGVAREDRRARDRLSRRPRPDLPRRRAALDRPRTQPRGRRRQDLLHHARAAHHRPRLADPRPLRRARRFRPPRAARRSRRPHAALRARLHDPGRHEQHPAQHHRDARTRAAGVRHRAARRSARAAICAVDDVDFRIPLSSSRF